MANSTLPDGADAAPIDETITIGDKRYLTASASARRLGVSLQAIRARRYLLPHVVIPQGPRRHLQLFPLEVIDAWGALPRDSWKRRRRTPEVLHFLETCAREGNARAKALLRELRDEKTAVAES
jgi:hypothetical protein